MKKMGYIPLGIGMMGGMVLGLLLAPKSGKELRKDMENLMNKMDSCDLKKSVKEITDDLKKIDGEEVMDEVKKQVKKVKKKVEKLVDCDLASNMSEIGDKAMNMASSAIDSFS